MHHLNQTHKTSQIWNGLRTYCPHVKTAQTESDDMWSKDSSLVGRISTFLWSVNAKAIQQTHRRWHVKLYVERAFICREGEFLRLETECLADAELFLGALCPDPGRFSSAHQGFLFACSWGGFNLIWGERVKKLQKEKIPSEMEVAPPHKRFTQFSALIKL